MSDAVRMDYLNMHSPFGQGLLVATILETLPGGDLYQVQDKNGTALGAIQALRNVGFGSFRDIQWTWQDQGRVSLAEEMVAARLTGLSVPVAEFEAGLGIGTPDEGNNEVSYAYLVSLLNGPVIVTGTADDEQCLEVGSGGRATVNSFAGDDALFLWHAKNLIWNGGAGTDTLRFGPQIGHILTPPGGAVVDLTTGNGRNPYGGTLKLSGVENVFALDETDFLRGNAANNVFDGQGGADTIRGEAGADQISIDVNVADGAVAPGRFVDGGPGIDSLFGIGDGVETANRLDLLAQNLNTGVFRGGQFVNLESFSFSTGGFNPFVTYDIRGANISEFLRVGSNADRVDGRGGNDTVLGMGGGDRLDGGAGIDTLDYSIAEGPAGVVVNLQANTAAGGDAQGDVIRNFEHMTGSNRSDRIVGSLANNVLRTTSGNDTVFGGGGNDVIFDTGGRCRLDGGAGNDAIHSTDFFADTVSGGAGNDNLMGSGAGDQLDGGLGNDRVVGRLGQDRLTGGAGFDRFVFLSDLDSGRTRPTADIIADFSPAQDVIDLAAIDARAGAVGNNVFAFRGTAAFTGEGQVRAIQVGNLTYVELNIVGSLAPDSIIRLNGAITLAANDFVL